MNHRQHQHQVERSLRADEERRVFSIAPAYARAWTTQFYNQRQDIQAGGRGFAPQGADRRGILVNGDHSRAAAGGDSTEITGVTSHVQDISRLEFFQSLLYESLL